MQTNGILSGRNAGAAIAKQYEGNQLEKAVATPRPSILATISELEEAISHLEHTVGDLGSSLRPLLLPEQPSPEREKDSGASVSFRSPAANHILPLTDRLRDLRLVVADLNERLDL